MSTDLSSPGSFGVFGGSKPWLPPPWSTSDDRVRGGSSRSSLSVLPNNCALFEGHLDIESLGGAGFASQYQHAPASANGGGIDSASDSVWDLREFEGLEVEVGAGDGKVYTLILRDEEPLDKRDDGRERAGVNWEAEFRVNENSEDSGKGKKVWVPWSALKATYRGRKKKDAGNFKPGEIRRIGFMMRSYFGTQHGDFRLELRTITAKKHPSEAAETALSGQE
ncbi:MAG: hypothetical protein L6R40_007038 [Gallowayella cf. fulva]|nr:MAG: hypothetical protein L6R40_007038 [Xanthomendoza cf. fulva]